MRLLLQNILYIIFIFSIFGTLFISYNLYSFYQSYQYIKERRESYYRFVDLNRLLKSIEEERYLSARYLSSSFRFSELREKRVEIDRLLRESRLPIYRSLSMVRDRVDSFKNREDIDYSIYEEQVIKPIFAEMEKLSFSEREKNILLLAKLYNNIRLEESFLTFIILKSKPMQSKDLEFWDNILANRTFPYFMHSMKFNMKDFQKIGDREYAQILIDAKAGNYRVSFGRWYLLSKQKLDKIELLESTLSRDEAKKLNKTVSHIEDNIKRYLVIPFLIVILVIVVLFFIYYLHKMHRESLYLKSTLRDIEVDIDIEKRRELEYLLKRNNSIEIYKFLANAIKEPNRAKDLFLANMSHEIRTPLNGIVGFTKELRQTPLNADQEEMLSIIEESSNQLIHIVNDILDFSKIKAGKVELEYIPFDPIATFESSVDTFIAKAREKNIELKVNVDPYISTKLIGDPTKLSQVLNNLISNAIKFTERGGVVVVSMLKIAEDNSSMKLKFVVKDSGIGISKEEKKRIFEAFSQADVSTSRKYGGTGLGLSISSQFIQYMGGVLDLESELGEGTSFFFSLDLGKTSSFVNYSQTDLSSYSVGYIPPIAPQYIDQYLKNYVEFYGAEFQTYNRYEILNLEESKLPNLLFIDYKCFKSQKQLEVFLDLPLQVVLIVADNREDEFVEIIDKIDYLLHKPVNFTRTLKALEVLKSKKVDKNLTQEQKEIKFVNKKLLVAEDNRINQRLMRSILERYGFEVEIVKNGQEAIDLYKKRSFDMVFMDIQMPIKGGVEATKEILLLEKDEKREHTPIVALTANALEGDREKYLNFGMDGYLSKPINIKSLEEILVEFTLLNNSRNL